MSGYVGDLSPSQEETLQRVRDIATIILKCDLFIVQFRRAVEDFPNKPEDSDHYYLRWLRGQ